ncbi:MAG: hypothetical protein ACO1OX_04800 [Novosphingobium sp.]
MNIDDLFSQMMQAGQALAGGVWQQMKSFAVPELKKIAVQIVAIAENAEDYTQAGARALLDMQMKAAAGVIVAMTTLTLLAVQDALNAIIGAVKQLVNSALGFVLI